MTDLETILTGAELRAIAQAGDTIEITTSDHTLTCAEARVVNASQALAELPVQLEGCGVAWWASAPGCGLVVSTTRGEYICIETVEITCARAAS
jgi:hypothetical protein